MSDDAGDFDREQWSHLPESEQPVKIKHAHPVSRLLCHVAQFISILMLGIALGMMIVIGQLVGDGVLPGSAAVLWRFGVWHTLGAGVGLHTASWLLGRYSARIDERFNDWYWAAIASNDRKGGK